MISVTRPEPSGEDRFITAEDALIDIEMHALGMRKSGTAGTLKGDEARKLAEYLFSDEEDGLPEDVKRFFGFEEDE
jgi:hypothetical protein